MKKIILCLVLCIVTTFNGKNFFSTVEAESVNARMTLVKTPIVSYEVLYNDVKATVYHAVPAQTDDTPFLTADNSLIDTSRVNNLRWVAISRDLLNLKTSRYNFTGKLRFGDTIWVSFDEQKILQKAFDEKWSKIKLEKTIEKYQKIQGYWVVKDSMGDYHWKEIKSPKITPALYKNKSYKINGKRVFVKVYQRNWIDFLQHPKTGMLHFWDKNIIIAKKNITYKLTYQQY